MILIFHYKFTPPIAPTFRNSAYFSVRGKKPSTSSQQECCQVHFKRLR